MSSAKRFYSMVPGLAKHYRVIRLDSRGHGESEVPPPHVPHDKWRLNKDVIELLDKLGIENTHIVAGSAGCYTAQLLAIHHPERVKSLILLSATPGFKGDQGKGWLRESARRGMRPVFAETIDERIPVAEADPRLIEWVLGEMPVSRGEYVGRKQYIAVAAGGNAQVDSKRGNSIIVFSLP
jgi:pimeloyl-ACP methyl ester carboxylesterase